MGEWEGGGGIGEWGVWGEGRGGSAWEMGGD